MGYQRNQQTKKKHRKTYMDDTIGRKIDHKKKVVRKKERHPES